MRRRECERGVNIGQRFCEVLPGQAVHHIQIKIIEMLARDADGAPRLRVVVYTSQRFQVLRIKTLYAQRQPIHPRGAVVTKTCGLHRTGIGFQRNFRIGVDRHARAHGGQYRIHCRARQQTRRATAEEHTADTPAPYARQRLLEIRDQRGDVILFWNLSAAGSYFV